MSSGRKRSVIIKRPEFGSDDVNVLAVRNVEPTIRRQDDETCCAHAFTALHEIVTGRRYVVADLVVHYMETIGSLMGEMSRNLSRHGQRAEADEQAPPAKRPRRGCRDRHRLDTVEYRCSAKKAIELLSAGAPLCVQIRNFDVDKPLVLASDVELQSLDDGPVFHAVCVVGFIVDAAHEGGGHFVFVNSFGEDWGEAGFGRISFAAFDTGRVSDMWSIPSA